MTDLIVWTAGEYLDQLKANLVARLVVAGDFGEVKVASAPIGSSLLPKEAVVLLDVEAIETPAALGGRRNQETVTVTGAIRILKLGTGDGDAIAKVARDRALAILAQLEAEVRLNPSQGVTSSQVNRAHVSRKALYQTVDKDTGGREAVVEFEITYGARTDVT